MQVREYQMEAMNLGWQRIRLRIFFLQVLQRDCLYHLSLCYLKTKTRVKQEQKCFPKDIMSVIDLEFCELVIFKARLLSVNSAGP